MIYIELFAVAFLLASLALTPPFRRWLSTIQYGDRATAIVILALLVVGQLLWVGRYTFPFVHWSMYTTVNDAEEFETVQCRAILATGESERFNPVREFPSLTRNFGERFQIMVTARNRGKLTTAGEKVYQEMMAKFLTRYQHDNPDNPAVAMEAVLITHRASDGCRLKEVVVSRTQWKTDQSSTVASVDKVSIEGSTVNGGQQ